MAERFQRVGGVLSYFTRHRTAANLLLVIMIVAGIAAIPRMRAQFFPDVIIDNVSISVAWDGAGASDVDLAIVQLLEPAVLSVEGVESAESTSREGRASITLEFEPGWDMARAADDVQAAVDTVSNLPDPAVRQKMGCTCSAARTGMRGTKRGERMCRRLNEAWMIDVRGIAMVVDETIALRIPERFAAT